jgi:hypothetical protein
MDNPWTFANWNLTAQGQYVLQYGMAKAEAAAAQAGTTLGGPRPPPPHGTNVKITVIQKRIIQRIEGGQSGSGPPV